MLTRISQPSSTRWIRWGVMVMSVAFATLLIAYFNPSPSLAQSGYPTSTARYLNDYAQLLTPEDAASIRQSFEELETHHGIEATVVTINSIQDYGTGDSTIESFATNLFNTWGIGSADKNNGILTLVSVGDRKVRIEVGSGYGTSLDSAMKSVIDEYMVPRFKQNDYSGGIRRGTEAIIRRVTNEEPAPVSQAAPQPVYSPSAPATYSPPSASGEGNLWLMGGGLGGVGAAGFGLKTYFRYRHRRCRQCGIQMVRLDEQSDNQFLNRGQQTEERLKSVDYDIWQCPSCQVQDLNRYGNLFSKYRKCKGCHYKTMSSRRRTLRAATYSSSGTAEVTETCKQCSYRNTYTVTIPRKQRSSSSSGSSSGGSSSGGGGGRSSGGGASGGW